MIIESYAEKYHRGSKLGGSMEPSSSVRRSVMASNSALSSLFACTLSTVLAAGVALLSLEDTASDVSCMLNVACEGLNARNRPGRFTRP